MTNFHVNLVNIYFFWDNEIVFILVDSYIDSDCDILDICINSRERCVGGLCIVKYFTSFEILEEFEYDWYYIKMINIEWIKEMWEGYINEIW